MSTERRWPFVSDEMLDAFYTELRRREQERFCECDRESIRDAISAAIEAGEMAT